MEQLIGGHPALDLVNTVGWRLDPSRREDRLPDLPAFLAWARRAGLDTVEGDDGDGTVIAAVRALREAAYEVLVAHARGGPVPEEPLRTVLAACAAAMGRAEPEPALPLRWSTPVRGAEDLPDVVAVSLFDLLDREPLERLRECAGDGCGWLYLDRSRNHSRRWCSSADCGNRVRVARFAARKP